MQNQYDMKNLVYFSQNLLLFSPSDENSPFKQAVRIHFDKENSSFVYEKNKKKLISSKVPQNFDFLLIEDVLSLSLIEAKLLLFESTRFLSEKALVFVKASTKLNKTERIFPKNEAIVKFKKIREFCDHTFGTTFDSNICETKEEDRDSLSQMAFFFSVTNKNKREISKDNKKEIGDERETFSPPKNVIQNLWNSRGKIWNLSKSALEMDITTFASRAREAAMFSRENVPISVSGISLGLPNSKTGAPFMGEDNVDRIFKGECFLDVLNDDEVDKLLQRNVKQIIKSEGRITQKKIKNREETLRVVSRLGNFDLAKEFGVPDFVIKGMDKASGLAVAAGLQALKNAKVELRETGKNKFALPEEMQNETGVIYASSFGTVESAIKEADRYEGSKNSQKSSEKYEFERKLLFKMLIPANCQLAQLTGAKGPNLSISAACSSTAQAIALASDWIRIGRCKYVLVVAADNATSPDLLPYVGNGFVAFATASTKKTPSEAAKPFDLNRNGMVLGMGATGLFLEASDFCIGRGGSPKAQLLLSQTSNSAFHASTLDNSHISAELERFVSKATEALDISRKSFARNLIYFAHDTGSYKNGGCALAESQALRAVFGAHYVKVLVCAVKGFLGHAMGSNAEDAVAVASLSRRLVPPMAHYKNKDPSLGDLLLSKGGSHDRKFAIHMAAGFGSQLVFLLYCQYNSNKCTLL